MKRAGNLWPVLVSDENLLQAIEEVNRTHRWAAHHRPNKCTAWVEETKPARVQDLRKILEADFEQAKPRVVERYDPAAQKWRTVSEPKQWPDQYVHHALVQVLQPVMMRGMDKYCCGSIRRRGTSYGKQAIERWMKKDKKGTKYCFAGDIRHFYDSLTPKIVMDRMRKLVKDRRVLDLIQRIVRDGVQIGAYTSQWFANTVLQPLDHLIREGGYGATHYIRYMDNITIFSGNRRKLHKLRKIIEAWLNSHDLTLKGDWQVFPTSKRLPTGLGFRYGRGYTLVRKRNLLRLKRQVARYRKRRDRGRKVTAGMADSIISRLGQIKHCNNRNIYKRLLRGEKLQRELKNIVRQKRRKETITWTMYLAQRARSRS